MKAAKLFLGAMGFAAGVAALIMHFYEPPFFKRVTANKYATVQIDNVTRGTKGSGVIISQAGTILTAAHLALPGDLIKVTTHYRGENRVHLALVGISDKESQLMILFTRERLPSAVKIGRSADIRDGEHLYTIGFPGTMPRPVISSGIVAQRFFMVRGNLPPRSILIGIDPMFGMSGSPIFNRSGELIGIFDAIFSQRAAGISRFWSMASPTDPLSHIIKKRLATSGMPTPTANR